MILTSESYSPYNPVRKVGASVLIMPADVPPGEPDYSADYTIGTKDIISMKITETVDICAKSFKPRTMVLDIINTFRFSILSDLTGREVRARAVIDGEEVDIGRFYIDKVIFIDGGLTARILASDVVTRLSRFLTGIFFNAPTPLSDIVSTGTGALDGLEFILNTTASRAVVYPEMFTEIDTAQNCIQRLAQAARSASVWCNRQMKVVISVVSKSDYVLATIPTVGIIRRNSEELNRRTDIVRVYGKNSMGDMNHAVGRHVNGFIMASIHNDFMYQTELEAIAQNRLEQENFRHRITLTTRCNPAIEAGDCVTLEGSDEKLIVIGQKIEFGKDGLICEMELVGKGQ